MSSRRNLGLLSRSCASSEGMGYGREARALLGALGMEVGGRPGTLVQVMRSRGWDPHPTCERGYDIIDCPEMQGSWDGSG